MVASGGTVVVVSVGEREEGAKVLVIRRDDMTFSLPYHHLTEGDQ